MYHFKLQADIVLILAWERHRELGIVDEWSWQLANVGKLRGAEEGGVSGDTLGKVPNLYSKDHRD